MQAIVYFQDQSDIKSYRFEKPLLNWIKQQFPQADIFDFDNESDRTVINYAEKLIKESQQSLIILDALNLKNIDCLVNILNYLADNQTKCFALQITNNDFLTKYLLPLDDHFLINEDESEQKLFIKRHLEKQ